MATFSKRDAFMFGWERFKERPFFLIGLFVFTTLISVFTSALIDAATGSARFVFNVLDFAIQIVLNMGLTLIVLRVHDSVETGYMDIFEPLHMFWKYLSATILTFIIVFFGLLLFIVPGIVAMIALAFTSYLIIDRNLGPIEAITESMRITHGHRWNILLFGLSLLVFNILGALLFGVGLLVTIPVSALATVYVYRWLLNPPIDAPVRVSSLTKALAALVVAVLIIGGGIALVSLAITSMQENTASEVLRDTQRKTDLAFIKFGADAYYSEAGVYPASLEMLVPEYLPALPQDPQTGASYNYLVYEDGSNFEACAPLETDPFGGVYCEFGIDPVEASEFGSIEFFEE